MVAYEENVNAPLIFFSICITAYYEWSTREAKELSQGLAEEALGGRLLGDTESANTRVKQLAQHEGQVQICERNEFRA